MAKKDTPAKDKTKAGAGKGKNLSPLEKARLARATGKGGAKKKKAKKNVMVFKAPEGEKPFFIKANLAFDKDGILSGFTGTRIKGNPTNENAKTVDLALWDPATLTKLGLRYAGPVFIRNEAKRLGANARVQLLLRVAIKKDDRAIKVSLKSAKYKGEQDKKAKQLEKKDAIYRALRKPANFLAPAFTKVKPFPTAKELKELDSSEE